MSKYLLTRSWLLAGLIFICGQLSAVTATTTVSANIVPRSSISMSDSIVLEKKLLTQQDTTHTRANGVSIVTSAFDGKNSARLKVNSSRDTAYDISIAPSSVISDKKANKMEIKNVRTLTDFQTAKNNEEQELVIEAMLKDPGQQDTGLYFGIVEINVNYN